MRTRRHLPAPGRPAHRQRCLGEHHWVRAGRGAMERRLGQEAGDFPAQHGRVAGRSVRVSRPRRLHRPRDQAQPDGGMLSTWLGQKCNHLHSNRMQSLSFAALALWPLRFGRIVTNSTSFQGGGAEGWHLLLFPKLQRNAARLELGWPLLWWRR